MLAVRLLLCCVVVAILLVQPSNGGWIRIRWPQVIAVAAKCYLSGCFSKQKLDQMCQGVNKATIAREEWQAVKPRYVQPVAGISNELILWHTGPDTCRMIGLSSYNCEKCIQNEACIKKHLSAFQDTDLSEGMDDIKYNFLIGQDGVIYEGRGWGVAGPQIDHLNAVSVAVIGDFTKTEPRQESLTALKSLITCGQSAGFLSQNFEIITTPEINGKAFVDMINRCNGFCDSG